MKRSDRKRLLEMARTRTKTGTGSHLQALRERKRLYDAGLQFPDLGDIRHAIVGGLATAQYMPERMTLDTDILIHFDDLQAVEEILQNNHCERTGSLTVGGSTWRMPSGRYLDVLALDRIWTDRALRNVQFDEKGRPFISLPYLVIMKLESGRLQDLADISRMLGGAGEKQVEEVRKVVKRYRPDDQADLDSMIRLGRLEYE